MNLGKCYTSLERPCRSAELVFEEGWTLTVDLEVGRCYQFRFRRDREWIKAGSCVLLFSLYSQPAFYPGYIVHPSTLLIPTRKWIFSQQHRRIQVDEAEIAQASNKMGGGRDSQPRFHHRPYHQFRMSRPADGRDI